MYSQAPELADRLLAIVHISVVVAPSGPVFPSLSSFVSQLMYVGSSHSHHFGSAIKRPASQIAS
jgi:hypothetical protein